MIVDVPGVGDALRCIVIEEAPSTAMREHVVRQGLLDLWRVTVITALGIRTVILSVLAHNATVAQDDVLGELRHKGMAELGLFSAERALVILHSFQGIGMLLGAGAISLFHIALSVCIVFELDVIRILKVPDANVAAG